MDNKKIKEMLKILRALDNDTRLKILAVLQAEPNLSFNDIARKTGIERGALAYHLGVLKQAGLVELKYERRSKKITQYRLTDKARDVLAKLGLDKVLE